MSLDVLKSAARRFAARIYRDSTRESTRFNGTARCHIDRAVVEEERRESPGACGEEAREKHARRSDRRDRRETEKGRKKEKEKRRESGRETENARRAERTSERASESARGREREKENDGAALAPR